MASTNHLSTMLQMLVAQTIYHYQFLNQSSPSRISDLNFPLAAKSNLISAIGIANYTTRLDHVENPTEKITHPGQNFRLEIRIEHNRHSGNLDHLANWGVYYASFSKPKPIVLHSFYSFFTIFSDFFF